MSNLDIACMNLKSLLQNPYAIERREKSERDKKESIKNKWECFRKVKNRTFVDKYKGDF